MSLQLQTGDAVRVLPTGEIGLLVAVHRACPESALVSLGAAGLWKFPIGTVGRLDDLESAFPAESSDE
jgi:hypothetical protein